MKKFTSFLLLSLAFMGTAGAQNAGTGQQATLPVELSASHDNPTYYYIKSRRTNQGKAIYLRYNGDNAGVTRQATPDNTGTTLWYFMASGTDGGVKIYSAYNNQKAFAGPNSFTTEGSVWYLLENPFPNTTTYYVIDKDKDPKANNNSIDASGHNNGIGWWNCAAENDQDGTSWTFEKVLNPNLNLAQAATELASKIDKTPNSMLVGSVKDVAALNKLIEGASNITTIKEYKKFLTDVSSCFVGIEANAYYELKNVNCTKGFASTQNMHFATDGSFPHANNEDRRIRRVFESDPLVPRLWKLESQNNGLYKIRNANTNCCWSVYVDNGIDMPVDAVNGGGSYSFETVESRQNYNTQFLIKIGGHMINAFQGNNNNILSDYTGNHPGDGGNYWQLRKVTQIPVTIGATKVATICLPFAVTLPAELQAYKAVSSDGTKVTLTEMTGVIPANTGMLLSANAEGTYNLTITNETGTAITDNKFQGATVRREGFAVDATYAMAASKTNANKAVLRLNGMTVIPANKAYMLSTDVPTTGAQQAAYLNFSFDNTTTGVESVETTTKEATKYYDLNGRLVLYPTKGIYVTSEGKKVYFQ